MSNNKKMTYTEKKNLYWKLILPQYNSPGMINPEYSKLSWIEQKKRENVLKHYFEYNSMIKFPKGKEVKNDSLFEKGNKHSIAMHLYYMAQTAFNLYDGHILLFKNEKEMLDILKLIEDNKILNSTDLLRELHNITGINVDLLKILYDNVNRNIKKYIRPIGQSRDKLPNPNYPGNNIMLPFIGKEQMEKLDKGHTPGMNNTMNGGQRKSRKNKKSLKHRKVSKRK
jgi:hypothetical protein